MDGDSILIHVDNPGGLQVSRDNLLNDRTKHIYVEYQLIMNNVKNGKTRLTYVSSGENISNIMTTALGKTLFAKFRNLMGVSSRTTCTP